MEEDKKARAKRGKRVPKARAKRGSVKRKPVKLEPEIVEDIPVPPEGKDEYDDNIDIPVPPEGRDEYNNIDIPGGPLQAKNRYESMTQAPGWGKLEEERYFTAGSVSIVTTKPCPFAAAVSFGATRIGAGRVVKVIAHVGRIHSNMSQHYLASALTDFAIEHARYYWPQGEPLPSVIVKRPRTLTPCPECLRIRTDVGTQAAVCTGSGRENAWFRCRVCDYTWGLGVEVDDE